MFLRFHCSLASYKAFTIDDTTRDAERSSFSIKLNLNQVKSKLGDTCIIDNKIDAYKLPIVLSINVGAPFGPYNSKEFEIRLQKKDYEHWRPPVPEKPLGPVVYVPKDPYFAIREEIGVDATISKETFAYLWDSLKSGHILESVIIEAFGNALLFESISDSGARSWHWQTEDSTLLLCNKIVFAFQAKNPIEDSNQI